MSLPIVLEPSILSPEDLVAAVNLANVHFGTVVVESLVSSEVSSTVQSRESARADVAVENIWRVT
jgi:hypothetical protein